MELGAASGNLWGRHIEEPVQVDAHRHVKNAPQQLRSRRSFQSLMKSVGRGQGIMHRVPVAKLVGGVEVSHAQEGSVDDGRSKLPGGSAIGYSFLDRPDNLSG